MLWGMPSTCARMRVECIEMIRAEPRLATDTMNRVHEYTAAAWQVVGGHTGRVGRGHGLGLCGGRLGKTGHGRGLGLCVSTQQQRGRLWAVLAAGFGKLDI